jgi:hypothetical protein
VRASAEAVRKLKKPYVCAKANRANTNAAIRYSNVARIAVGIEATGSMQWFVQLMEDSHDRLDAQTLARLARINLVNDEYRGSALACH